MSQNDVSGGQKNEKRSADSFAAMLHIIQELNECIGSVQNSVRMHLVKEGAAEILLPVLDEVGEKFRHIKELPKEIKPGLHNPTPGG